MTTEEMLNLDPYSLDQIKKEIIFRSTLLSELSFHYANNNLYRNFCEKKGFSPDSFSGNLSDIPAIPVSVFKHLGSKLISVPDADVKLTLQSSATSGIPSTILLDKITSKRQAKVMVKIMQQFIGKERRPFLIADIKPSHENIKLMGARFAAIAGYLNFANSVQYVFNLNENGGFVFDKKSIQKYFSNFNENNPIVIFGFTYIIFSYLFRYCKDNGIKLPLPNGSMLIHIGGWKKLESEKVSKEEFNSIAASIFNINKRSIIDVYGFTEQMGLNYPDCECGCKHVPVFSEIIVRNPSSGRPVSDGELGVLEFLTPIPHSYPGNVILTDDIGIIETGACKYGKNGKRFKVLGRIKNSEIRGCGDVLGNKMIYYRKNEKLQFNGNIQVVYHNHFLTNPEIGDENTLLQIISHLNESRIWLSNQSIDNLIGLISVVAKKWLSGVGEIKSIQDTGISFLANWCSAEHLNRIATFSLRGDRRFIDDFLPFHGSKKQYLKANQRGLVCHWLAGNVQILGMFALIQSILSKNANLLKISSRDNGIFLQLLKSFEGVTYVSKGGSVIKGDDLLKTISIIYFNHHKNEFGEIMSNNANVRIAWGGKEAVEAVSLYPKKIYTEDILFGPKLSFSVLSSEMLDSTRNAYKIARKIAVDISIFDQTGCASPHNLFIETGGVINPFEFSEILGNALQKVSQQIIKGDTTPEQSAAIHSVKGLYDFKGMVWGSDDLTWTVLYDPNMTLNQPIYSRVIVVHPVLNINDALRFIDENIQSIGLGAKGKKALDFAMQASSLGVSRCPELGKMLNFESPWDGIVLMDRLVKWSTLGGPIV